MQEKYYKTSRRSDLKIPRILCIFICKDMNNQMIANHSHIYIFISFIFMDTNNQMITNHPRLSANEKHIIRKSHLMSLSSVYIPI